MYSLVGAEAIEYARFTGVPLGESVSIINCPGLNENGLSTVHRIVTVSGVSFFTLMTVACI
jgi:hypothetical protein